jgi:vacuolar protein sorting-associated protein 54
MSSRPGLANHLRNMDHTDFLVLMQELYMSLLNGVEGLQEQGRVVIDIMDSLNQYVVLPMQLLSTHFFTCRPPKGTPTPTSMQDELADILSSAAELSNTQAAKVISLRADQHATLELADFLVFFNESWGFVVKCEIICRRMIVGLRGVVVSQVCIQSHPSCYITYRFILGKSIPAEFSSGSHNTVRETCRG